MPATELIAHCAKQIANLTWLGEAFIYLALSVAAVTALLAVIEAIRAMLGTKPEHKQVGVQNSVGTTIDAVTKLIEALIKAPSWFAMIVAGFALLWLAAHNEKQCRAGPDGGTSLVEKTAQQTSMPKK